MHPQSPETWAQALQVVDVPLAPPLAFTTQG